MLFDMFFYLLFLNYEQSLVWVPLCIVQTGSGAHSVFNPVLPGDVSLEAERSECESYLPPSSAEFKNAVPDLPQTSSWCDA
jgi:hypothetical protein